MRIPVALYPFCAELLPVVRHFEQLQDKYTLKRLIAPLGLGLTGKDAAHSCNHPDIGMIVTDNLGLDEEPWDVLLLTRSLKDKTLDTNEYNSIIRAALQAGKTITYYDKNTAGIQEHLHELLEAYPGKINLHSGELYSLKNQPKDTHDQINTPVILVGGLVPEADTFDVLLSLAIRLREDGMHPVVLTRHPIGEFFGFHHVSHVFDDSQLSEAEKIAKLNTLVKDFELSEVPDVILMEAPDAIMRYNDTVPNGYGILTYMLCQGVPPDYLVCCTPCDLGVGAFVDAISMKLSACLGSPIHAVHVSNVLVDLADMQQTKKISFAHADLGMVRKQIAGEKDNSPIPLCNVIEDGIDELYAVFSGTAAPAI